MEYKVEHSIRALSEFQMNEIGELGWELVSVVHDSVNRRYSFYFKREKNK